MDVFYSPADFKPEKVGKKYRVVVTVSGSNTDLSMEFTQWGNTPEEAMTKTRRGLNGAKPKPHSLTAK